MFPEVGGNKFPNSMKTAVREKLTSGKEINAVYVSSQSPMLQSRFTALRLACLRALSSEYTFNDNTPMMFSDSVIGTALVLVFKVADLVSRGHVRRYALICLGEDETMTLNSWNVLAPRFEALARSIQDKARRESERTDPNKLVPDRYLRIRGAKVQSRSLASIVNDPVGLTRH